VGRIRFAFRSLAKSPLLSLVVVLSLGLGIGVNTWFEHCYKQLDRYIVEAFDCALAEARIGSHPAGSRTKQPWIGYAAHGAFIKNPGGATRASQRETPRAGHGPAPLSVMRRPTWGPRGHHDHHDHDGRRPPRSNRRRGPGNNNPSAIFRNSPSCSRRSILCTCTRSK
jgi:hypothetical protein